VTKSLTALWDLPTMLDALSNPPFEPQQNIQLKMLSFKTALLLALITAKRVSDIHALSVNLSCMQFLMGGSKVLLKPNPAFSSKVYNLTTPYRPIEPSTRCPLPYKSRNV